MTLWLVRSSASVACLAIALYLIQGGPGIFKSYFQQNRPQQQLGLRSTSVSHNSTEKPSWNRLYHLGGHGPWIQKVQGVVDGDIDPPLGCRVDQVHMISRHAERYPTVRSGIRMLELYQRIAHADMILNESLSFANDWNFFTEDPSSQFENLVTTGPYAGTLAAFSAGVKLRTRYKQLLDQAIDERKTSVWASDSRRVIDTARYFAAGFFGIDWDQATSMRVVPETSSRAADTLTPGRTCLKYINDVDDYGHEYGSKMLSKFVQTYLGGISDRFAASNPNLLFSGDEIYVMQEICGFETMALGSSKWCEIFTDEEMESYEYARDVLHYYRSGPGNPYSALMGRPYLNAMSNLMREGPKAGPLFFTFVHDGDIVPLLAALDILPQTPPLPTTHILTNRTWRVSDIVPMGGRLIFERLACPASQECWTNAPFYPNHIYCAPAQDDHFVRININDGIVALPGCDTGPGQSCDMQTFLEGFQTKDHEVGEYGVVCGLAEDAPKRITFLQH